MIERHIFFSVDASDLAIKAAKWRGLVLHMGLSSMAPPDGTWFTASIDCIAESSCLTPKTVGKLLPILAAAGVLKLERVKRCDLHELGFVRIRMPAVPADAIQELLASSEGSTKGAK